MKKCSKRLATIMIGIVGVGISFSALADNSIHVEHSADNTARNIADKSMESVLPEDQSNDTAYIRRTAAIRKEVVAINNMSVKGQNVKIITLSNGLVVLRGPVESSSEKTKIEEIAKRLSGKDTVKSYLEVANG